jgi:hypothetical protein
VESVIIRPFAAQSGELAHGFGTTG